MKIFVLSLAFLGLSTTSQATVFVSECNHPIFLAFGVTTGGGVDDLNGNTSWVKFTSSGWYRLGPFEKSDFGWAKGGAVYITTAKGRILNAQANDQNFSVTPFCLKRGEKFNYESRNSNVGKRGQDCVNQGGQFLNFQNMRTKNWQNYPELRIKTDRCDQ